MRLLDELWLRVQIKNAVAIPVMARARNQILRMEVCRIACRSVIRVIADVEPDVDVAVDKSQTIGGDVEISVTIVVVQIGRAGYRIELSFRKSPFAPLLGIIDLEDTGDQRRSRCGCDLIGALFGAGAVKVAARCRIAYIGIEGLVLGAKARCAVYRDTITEWEERFFDVLGVVTKVGPSLAITVVTEHGIDRRDAFRGIQVGNIGAEMEEILGAICRVPVKLLPRVGWIVHWPPNRESNRHGEVSVVYQRLKAEQCLELRYRLGVVCSNQCIELVDDVIDTRDAVLGSEFLNRSVPLRIGEHRMNDGATGNTAIQQVAILLNRERSLSPRQASTIQDPRSPRRR